MYQTHKKYTIQNYYSLKIKKSIKHAKKCVGGGEKRESKKHKQVILTHLSSLDGYWWGMGCTGSPKLDIANSYIGKITGGGGRGDKTDLVSSSSTHRSKHLGLEASETVFNISNTQNQGRIIPCYVCVLNSGFRSLPLKKKTLMMYETNNPVKTDNSHHLEAREMDPPT